MYKVFNMGIGMVLVISPESIEGLRRSVKEKGEELILIGEVTDGKGMVKIKGIDL